MGKEVVVAEQFEQMQEVVELFMTGKSQSEIARELSISRAQVLQYMEGWKKFAANADVSSRAKETLNQVDMHYQMLIKETHKVLEETTLGNDIKNRLASIKLIADMEGKRQQLYQAAGLSYDNETARKIAETEDKLAIVQEILRDDLCPSCKTKVAGKLSALSGKIESVRDMPGGNDHT